MKKIFYLRFFSFLALILAAITAIPTTISAQTNPVPYYSTFDNPQPNSQYSTSISGACIFCGITNPERAADQSLTNYATLETGTGLSTMRIKLKLNGTATNANGGNYRAGVVVGRGGGLALNASLLSSLTVTTFEGSTSKQDVASSSSVVTATALPGNLMRLEFLATSYPFDHIRVEIKGVGVANTLNVYYAYALPAEVVTTAAGALSSLQSPTSADYSTSISGAVCIGTGVSNARNAVSQSLNDYATMSATGVGCSTSLGVRLASAVPAGYHAGFVVGGGSLLDLDALKRLQIKTYLNGVEQETATAGDLLQVSVLPDGKYQVHFASNHPFDYVELDKTSLVSLATDLNIYYGFGVEPRAFRDQTPVLSDYPATQAGSNVQNTTTAALCVGCSISNPERAADADLTNYAQMNFPVSVLGTQSLRMNLNGNPEAGNRAGVVLDLNTPLLSATLLENITLRTYDADGNLVESASGSSLLNVGLVGGKHEVSFLTTRDFASVEVQITGGVGLFANARIYNAFADDPLFGFPSIITKPAPLPVVLLSFEAKALSQAVELVWKTASEKNSSSFVVERAAGADTKFEAVGQVAAAGNSTAPHRYTLLDAEISRMPAGTYYYRLRQLDVDGTATLSPVQAVRWQPKGYVQLEVFPNPATETANVRLKAGSVGESAVLRLYGLRGELVHEQPMAGIEEQLPLRSLRAGLYQLVLSDAAGRNVATQRLVVQGR